jgi:diguanylate cyclase (GGDEF)-like protein
MDHLLRPGMRLMRRFPIAGRFVTIALALLVPLSIVVGALVTDAAEELRTNVTERRGLVVARPLALLVTDLHQWRIAAVTGRERPDLAAAVSAVDDAEHGIGADLGLDAEWVRLRAQVLALTRTDAPGVDSHAVLTARLATTLLDRLGNASRLVLDPQLDSYHLAITLTDRLPALLDAAASATEALPARRPSAHEAYAVGRQLIAPARQLTGDVGSAIAGSRWAELDARLRPAATTLDSALADFDAAISAGLSAPAAVGDSGRRVTSSVQTMITTVADALDQLLADCFRHVVREFGSPIMVATLAVLVAAYLFAGFARITSQDARRVLADINTLTTGALHQTRPLVGSDEFAHMSQAVVVARDRLTSLLGALRYQATHDELTALANRALFTEKLTEALADPVHRPGVVVIDLDGLKDVNDSFGHVIGDRLLRALGARFHRAARRRDLVARLGPDQFGVLIIDAGDDRRTSEAVGSLKAALEQPVDVDGRLLRVQASVGIAISPDGGTTATELLRNADVATHEAKSNGTGALVVFEPAMHEATRERTELSFELVHAVEDCQLTVVYQPIVDLATERVESVEALIRWDHPERGVISPNLFVPLAEATGLIVPIGRWVMQEAITQLARWRRDFPDRHVTMDINLSADQLSDPDLVGDVLSLVSDTGVDPRAIVLEITESALVQDLDTALRRLGQLAAVGVRLALDDFGTGYSSLSYLRRLPVTVLKIDKSFVTAADTTPAEAGPAEVLLRGIVGLGRGLGMDIIAEGIETPDQARRLRDAGCHYGQGYLWSRPVTAPELGAILRRGPRRPDGLPHPREGEPSAISDAITE